MMAHEFEGAPSMGGDAPPVYYAIMRTDAPGMYWAGQAVVGGLGIIPTIHLFTSESAALECLANHYRDPENAEVVSSDEAGGILALLDYAAEHSPLVSLDPSPTRSPVAAVMDIATFINEYVRGGNAA